MAMGILMSLQLPQADEAFTLLRIVSRNRNRKIHDIADDVVATGTVEVPSS